MMALTSGSPRWAANSWSGFFHCNNTVTAPRLTPPPEPPQYRP
jgi:hypothetical protein